MKRYILFLIASFVAISVSAQRITHDFRDVSMSKALKMIEANTSKYKINFIYNELEDFTVTTSIDKKTVPDAIRDVIGFYPIRMTVDGDNIFVECIQKENTKLIGEVIDKRGQPIVYANISLLSAKDSTFINGGVSNLAGKFVIPCSAKHALVKVSCIGYKTKYVEWTSGEECDVKMVENSKVLGEVVVKGHRNFIKSTNTGLSISMDNNPLSKLSSAVDAIKQMPMIDGSGNDISVLGKGTPEIYINQRKVRNMSEVSQLSPQNIKSVDIITNPGAQYGSDVKSVIVIHTKRLNSGLAGVLKLTESQSEVSSASTDADISWMGKNGLGLYASANVADDGFKQKRIYTEKFNENKDETITHGAYKSRSKSLKLTGGTSYDFKENSLGIRYEFSRTPETKFTSNSDINTNADAGLNNILSSSKDNSRSFRHYVNAYSLFKFGIKKNYELSADIDYLYGMTHSGSETEEYALSYQQNINTENNSTYHLAAAKVNLKAVWNSITVNFGGQYSYTKNLQNFAGGTSNGSSFFKPSRDKEKQDLYAGYASLNYKYNKYWNADAGLRFENTDFNYEQNGITIPTQSKTYNDWIPSLGLNYSNNGFAMGISYNTNISRPSYSMLNNNYFYVSHTSWETGNPLLLSSKDHNIDLHFSYNHTYITASYTRRKRNISTTYTYLENQNVNVRQEINLPDYDRFQIVASQSFDIGKWHPTLQGLLQFQNLKYGSPEKHYDSPLGRLMMNNRFDLPWHVYAYLSGMYLTKGHDATVYSNSGAMVYMMLNKSIGKWAFNLLANDFISSWRQKNLVKNNGVYYLDNRKGASCFVRLSVTYSFNHKNTFKGKGASKEELNRL